VVTVTETPVRRLLVYVAVGVAATGLLVVGLWLLSGIAVSTFASANSVNSAARATATVVTSASCQGGDDHDTVSFSVGGAAHQAKLDGCGRQPGETLAVLVPANLSSTSLVEPAATAPGDASGLLHRVSFLLLIVSAAVGGAYCHFLLRRTARRSAGRTATAGRSARSARSGGRGPVGWFADTNSGALAEFTDSR
jgi:hypothetical protein